MTRVVLQYDALDLLPEILHEVGARRIVLITGPEKRFLERVRRLMRDFELELAPFAEVHVPERCVSAASDVVRSFGADTVVTLGGGAATGLGKALCLEHDLEFVAIPTTFAGSEMTNIFGVTSGQDKRTGRDDRVVPDVVIYDPCFTERLPKSLTVTSLLNALAHPVSALSTGKVTDRSAALEAAALAFNSALQLIERPLHPEARMDAIRAAQLAGAVLRDNDMGAHHALAHVLGGRFKLPHAELHALLLPHTLDALHRDRPDDFDALAEATGEGDLPAAVFDLLRRAGVRLSLRSLDVTHDALETLLAEREELPAEQAWLAYHGRRPSVRVRREDWDLGRPVSIWGNLETAEKIVIAIHGRGSDADEVLAHLLEWPHALEDVAVVAPQADGAAWYGASYRDAAAKAPEALANALGTIDAVLERVLDYVPRDMVALYGFSQGACLAAEYLARADEPLGALIAVAGARIGPVSQWPDVGGDLDEMPVLLSLAEEDAWIDFDDFLATRDYFEKRGAEVTAHVFPGTGHVVPTPVRVEASRWLSSEAIEEDRTGFGNTFEVELMPGALPRDMNSPRWVSYGLYSEQVNATAFVAPRAHNFRSWLYRVRPSAQLGTFEPLEHPTLIGEFSGLPSELNLIGLAPPEIPEDPADFVDGLITVGGNGSPAARRGYAVHLYVANRDMEGRAFYNADGEFLIIPQAGRLHLLTETGVLMVAPGEVVIVPRGLRFSVALLDGTARGYVGETFGYGFELPERGLAGANGFADARHFRVPDPWFENRLEAGYRITGKLGGRLYEARQDYSPFDVVAWHGNYTAYAYDLEMFSPFSTARIDHPDPSVYTVLSAPLDERGGHALDFVFFPPRWDVSENTFRPPFFHRSATTEINGIIMDPDGDHGPFCAGGVFVTPSMTPHGVRHRAVERIFRTRDAQDEPFRSSSDSMWFQFESALPIALTPWAKANALGYWHDQWGAYRTFFDPEDEE